MNSTDYSAFPDVPRGIGLTVIAQANEQIVMRFTAETAAEQQRCQEVLTSVWMQINAVRKRASDLGVSIDFPTLSIPLPPPARLPGKVLTAMEEGTALHHHALDNGKGSTLHAALRNDFSFGEGESVYRNVLLTRGIPADVDAFREIADRTDRIPADVDEPDTLIARASEWLKERYLALRGLPIASQTRLTARMQIRECLEEAEKLFQTLATRPAPVELFAQKKHWMRLARELNGIIVELREFDAFLNDPLKKKRETVHHEQRTLEESLEKLDARGQRLEERIRDLEKQNGDAASKGYAKGQRISRHAGTRQEAERAKHVAEARKELLALIARRQKLRQELQGWHDQLDTLDPAQEIAEAAETLLARLEAIQDGLELRAQWREEDGREFQDICKPVLDARLRETATAQSQHVLQRLPEWVRESLEYILDDGIRAIEVTKNGDPSEIQKELRRGEEARIQKTDDLLDRCAEKLAHYLARHPKAVREAMLEYLRKTLPMTPFDPPPERIVGNTRRLRPPQSPQECRSIGMSLLEKAAELIDGDDSQSEAAEDSAALGMAQRV